MEARQQIADFLGALILVYTLIIFASIIVSWVFSFGVRVPYSRPLNAVLDFLRDVTNPYLRIFRRLGLQFGPIDFSPIVAILVLTDRRQHPRRADPARLVSAGTHGGAGRARRGGGRHRRSGHEGDRPRARSSRASAWTSSSASTSSTPATPASRSACSPAAGRWS